MNKKDDKKKKREYMRQWSKKNPDKIKKIRIATRLKLKTEAFNAYCKGEIKCACCGETEFKFMTIDHINDDGAEHRRNENIGKNGLAMFHWLRKNNYPKGFQVLCWNCNCAKHYYGKCPHQN